MCIRDRLYFFPWRRRDSQPFHSWELVPHFGVGNFFGNCCCFSPFAQFDLVADWQEGFQEHGAGAFDMTHQSQLSQFLRSEAGFRFYKIKIANWGNTVVMVKGSYVNKKTFSTGAVSAAIVGADGFFGVETSAIPKI